MKEAFHISMTMRRSRHFTRRCCLPKERSYGNSPSAKFSSAGIQVCPCRQRQRLETIRDLCNEISTIGDVFLLSSHRMAVKFGFLCRGQDLNNVCPPMSSSIKSGLKFEHDSVLKSNSSRKEDEIWRLRFSHPENFLIFEIFLAVMR